MEFFSHVLDLGSNTAKLYERLGDGRLRNIDNVSWRLLDRPVSADDVKDVLSQITDSIRTGAGKVYAIGTEAFRRHLSLAMATSDACDRLGIHFRVLSQEEEAALIRSACRLHGISDDWYVVNAGGGSTQIIHPGGSGVSLLPFGVADLTRLFQLDGPPASRRVASCTAWVASHFPNGLGSFAYTGGELTYLTKVGARMELDGTCTSREFLQVAAKLTEQPIEALESLSPFGPGWMRGAVASNCIVDALLRVGGADRFLPSDLNISHGLLEGAIDPNPSTHS